MELYRFFLFSTLVYSTVTFTLPDGLVELKNTSNISPIVKGYKEDNPLNCGNGGKRILQDGVSFCMCKPDYFGELCELTNCKENNAVNCYNAGKCILQGEKPICKCTPEFTGEQCEHKKCEENNAVNCYNRGDCVLQGEKSICRCFPEFTGEQCEHITDTFCDEKYEKCRSTYGECSLSEDDKYIQCDCKGGVTYNTETGCEITDRFCDEMYENCRSTDGRCSISQDGKYILCDCKGGVTYNTETGCKNDFCPEVCGTVEGVKCIGERTDKYSIICFCDEESKIFVDRDQGCKDDFCPEVCGTVVGVKCIGERTDKYSIICSCVEESKSFVDKDQGCKVMDENCNLVKPKCKETGGSCDSEGNNIIQCKCPETADYIEDIGCRITLDGRCSEYLPQCEETDGYCTTTQNKDIQCNCPDNKEYKPNVGCEDKCSKMKCYNDGKCYINNGTAICNCTANFTGKYCEKNKCSLLKCLNNGTCEIKGDKAVCRCNDGFTGNFCEKNLTSVDDTGDSILVSFYFNKNSTFAKGAKFDFHFGRKKESNRTLTEVLLRFNSESVVPLHNDTCSLISCKNGGSCEVKNGKATCACTDHYFGEYCEKKCNCKNGKCVEMSEKVDCVCNPEFGKYEEGVCKACGCGKGATCTFEGSRWSPFKNKTCICPENFIEINHICVDPDVYNPCRSNPCENGARCEKNGFEAKCICMPGYSGKLCQYDKCSLIKCLNRGKCEVRNERAMCICNDNFTGEFCENENHGYVREGVLQEE